MYTLVEKCHGFLCDQMSSEMADDADDGTVFQSSADSMKMMVEDILAIFDESESASLGIPRMLSPAVCEKTQDGYCQAMGDYVLFLVPLYSNGFASSASNNSRIIQQIEVLFGEDINGDEVHHLHLQQVFVMQMLIGSMHLEKKETYRDIVESEVTMAELYCLVKGIHKQKMGESKVIFNFKGPATVQGAASRLFYRL